MLDRKLLLKDIYDEIERAIEARVGRFLIGQRLNLAAPTVGVLPPSAGGSGTNSGGEPALGNPPGDHYVLTSTAAGVRQWMQIVGAAGITVTVDAGAGTITISNTTLLDTLTFGPDDLTWGGSPLGWSTT